VVVHSQGSIVFANPAGATLIGAASPAEMIGTPVIQYVHPDYREMALKRIQQAISEGIPAPAAEEKFIRLDGTPIDVQVAAVPFSYAGKPAMLTVCKDITERKQAEAALRASEEKYRDLVAEIGDGIFITDERGEVTFVNPALVQIHGFEHPEQLVGRNFMEFVAPSSSNEVALYFRRVAEGELPKIPVTLEIVRPDGMQAVIEVKASVKQDGGKITGTHGVVRDITERKRAESKLNEQLAELQRWHTAMLGREGRILVLKREVNELLAQAGQPPRYPSAAMENPPEQE
jgi:PAS domain S-box-containing protein